MATEKDPLESLRWLLGEWRGYSIVGKKLNTIHKRVYLDLGGVFLVERTLSMIPPGGPSTDYEVHQDLTVFHAAGEELKAKGFFIEGFVSSDIVTVEKEGAVIKMESERVENGPPQMRTRYTLTRQSLDKYQGRFEIAWDGVKWQLSQKLTMQRVTSF